MTSILPHITASLNALTLCLLVAGFVSIRQRRREAHRAAMIAALTTSAVFLGVYLTYHFTQPIYPFQGQGAARPLYYFVLITHVVLAAAVMPLVLVSVARALRGNIARHRSLARWALPVWVYVSVTGIIVYVMLYRIDWAAAQAVAAS